ncbi:hypothetical protein ACLVWU_08720 [Bdellovibrio sp. HCB290]|uniref:hypothetical protein n=1 Tax=Bdellovibrio sp. HCB290 TaxID=3394356 RepID=UPI0039B3D574
MKFEYNILDSTDLSNENDLCVTREPQGCEVVNVQFEQSGRAMILANQEGWRYLAKICLEMAYASDIDPYFHIHRTAELDFSENDAKHALSFAQISEDLEIEILAKRSSQ